MKYNSTYWLIKDNIREGKDSLYILKENCDVKLVAFTGFFEEYTCPKFQTFLELLKLSKDWIKNKILNK